MAPRYGLTSGSCGKSVLWFLELQKVMTARVRSSHVHYCPDRVCG